ncbi:MAG: septum formation initiator family protein [Lentisphaeria bacterium]|nr:septum formation initiator family protein [Lentisphaeria bacterium]
MAQIQNRTPVISFGFYLFCLLIGVIFLGAAFLLFPVWKDLKNQEKKLAELKAEITTLKNDRNEILEKIADLEKSPDAVEKVAREKFKLVRPGDTVYEYTVPGKKKSERK